MVRYSTIKNMFIFTGTLVCFFLLFLIILPIPHALELTLSLPFLFFLPGYWLMKFVKFHMDYIERAVLTITLSLTSNYFVFHFVEKITTKFTLSIIIATILAINIITPLLYIIAIAKKFYTFPKIR